MEVTYKQGGQRASQAVQCVGGTERERERDTNRVVRQLAKGKECRLLPRGTAAWLSNRANMYPCECIRV